jgi:hypothetical protein
LILISARVTGRPGAERHRVGAKVAAGSRNPHGLEYRSWHHGHGALVRFRRDRHGHSGLEAQQQPDGTNDYWRPLEEDDKPWALRGVEHSPQVVLLGTQDTDEATRAPGSVTEGRRHWIARYLNSRFVKLPDRIELLVPEPGDGRWDEPAPLQRIHGQLRPPPRGTRREIHVSPGTGSHSQRRHATGAPQTLGRIPRHVDRLYPGASPHSVARSSITPPPGGRPGTA